MAPLLGSGQVANRGSSIGRLGFTGSVVGLVFGCAWWRPRLLAEWLGSRTVITNTLWSRFIYHDIDCNVQNLKSGPPRIYL